MRKVARGCSVSGGTGDRHPARLLAGVLEPSPARCTSRPSATARTSARLRRDHRRLRRRRRPDGRRTSRATGRSWARSPARWSRRVPGCSTRRWSCRPWRTGGHRRRRQDLRRPHRGRVAQLRTASSASRRRASTGPTSCSPVPSGPRPGPPAPPAVCAAWGSPASRWPTPGAAPTCCGSTRRRARRRLANRRLRRHRDRAHHRAVLGAADADLRPHEGVERRRARRGRGAPRRRGLVADGAFTDAGRAAREAVEQVTDDCCRPMVDALGDDLDKLVAVLGRWGATIRDGQGYPRHPAPTTWLARPPSGIEG